MRTLRYSYQRMGDNPPDQACYALGVPMRQVYRVDGRRLHDFFNFGSNRIEIIACCDALNKPDFWRT